MVHKTFKYERIDDLIKDIKQLNLDIPISDDIDILKRNVTVEGFTMPNSIALHPMEGADGLPDGSPSELTIRRYRRFASGGTGLIWFEATAVAENGKANSRQLFICRKNIDEYRKLLKLIIDTAHEKFGIGHTPLCIMQITHSGRFSRPFGESKPIIAYHNPYLNQKMNIDENHSLITDYELEKLEDDFLTAAKLAKEAGFHGVDIKGCHRYLISELFSAYTRKGKYGGSFENRTRFIRNVYEKIKNELGEDFIVTTRINAYDGIPHPYGWGCDSKDFTKYDLKEPVKLVENLYEKGLRMINITMGTPYYNPHVNRPYDKGKIIPDENQLRGVERLLNGAGEIQARFPDIAVVSTGYTWLRHFSPYFAAGNIESGKSKIAGFGREAFAYPDFASDILKDGRMKKEKCCITCGKCSEIMKNGGKTGCVLRDSSIYAPLYKEYCR